MRRIISAFLAVLLLFLALPASAEQVQKAPDYIMEGFDGDGSNHVWDTNLFFARMQEKTGISFQFRQWTEYADWTTRKQGLINGESLPDVLFKASLTARETQQMAASGVLIDLSPYLEQYAPNLWQLLQQHEDWRQAITMPDGSIPALPLFDTLQNNDAMWINTAWLKKLKVDLPTTAEELTEALRAIKTGDPNGNGQADEVPLTFIGMWELRFLGHAFGIIDNDYYICAENSQVTSSLTSDENRAFLSWLHTLWTEGLLDRNGFSTADSLRQITDEKKTIPYGMILSTSPMSVVPVSAASQYSLLQPLQWQGKQVYRDLLGDVVRGAFAITSACKEPEKLVSWVDTLYTEKGARMAQYGLEGVEYLWNENGYWEWNADLETVANVYLAEHTLGEGGVLPGLAASDFQLKYFQDAARIPVEELAELKTHSVIPYPPVFLSEADADRIAQIQQPLDRYVQQTMACFVTGDLPLDDAQWDTFCANVKELGLDEMVSIWQKYVK